MLNNKVSIIIPMFNTEKYVSKTLLSIANQTYKNIEVIVIDDSSTDKSYSVVEEFKKNSTLDIKLIKQFNQNGAVARNRGIELASGEYVYFIDSDDEIYSENTINDIVNKIENKDLLIGNYEIVNEKSEHISDEIIKRKGDNIFDYANIQPFPAAKLYKKEIIDKHNLYFSNVRIGQDLNFYLKYICYVQDFAIYNNNISKYRIVSNSMSRKKGSLNFLDTFHTIKEVEKEYKKCGLTDIYETKIIPVAISHFIGHLTKVNNFERRSERKYIYNSINFFIKSLLEGKKKTKEIKHECRRYLIIKILLKTRTFNLVKKILKK